MTIHVSELKEGEITYTHKDPNTGEYRHFAIERIQAWLDSEPEKAKDLKFIIPVDPTFARFIGNNRGIEEHRLLRLFERGKWDAILVAKMPDGTHLIIDGNHRYVAAAMAKLKEITAIILSSEHWEPFLVEGISDEISEYVLSAHSGIQ